MSSLRLPLKQAQGILDCVDQRPVEFEQLMTSAPSKDKSRQRSTSGRSAIGQLAAKLGEGDRFVSCDLGQAGLKRGEGVWVRENLRGLLQSLVLVNRNQGCGRSAVAGHQDVIASIADIVKQAA